MTKAELRDQVLQLPLEDQLDLVQEVWDRAGPEPSFVLTDELRELLRERRREALEHPEAGIPWEEVEAELLGRE